MKISPRRDDRGAKLPEGAGKFIDHVKRRHRETLLYAIHNSEFRLPKRLPDARAHA